MSNTSAPNGLTYMFPLNGTEPNIATRRAPILYTNPNSIGYGDPVIQSGGYIDKWSSGVMTGVFYGCEYTDSTYGWVISKAWTAPSTAVSGSVEAIISVDNTAVFQIQAGNSSTTGVTIAQVGLNAAFGSVGAPSSGNSTAYLDVTTISTTSTLPVKIVGFGTSPTNDVNSAYNWVQVIMNNQSYNLGTTGA